MQNETTNADKTQPIKEEKMDDVKTQFTEMKTKQDEMKTQQNEMKNSLNVLQEQTSLILAFMKEINNKTV